MKELQLQTTPTSFRRTLLAAALLATLGTAGCHKSGEQPGQLSDHAAADAPKESATLSAAIDDAAITAKVKGRIAADGRTQGTDISVETNNGVVTLKGAVGKSEQKKAAAEIARSTESVKGVDDQLTAPSAMDTLDKKVDAAAENADRKLDQAGDALSDAWITAKVKADLAADAQVKDARLSVSTTNGSVTLSGSVPSQAVRNRAVVVAKQVKGVKHVDDSAVSLAK